MSERCAARVRGIVQGVGFRPFVAQLARAMCLAGFVRNTAEGAEIEVEGDAEALARFRLRLCEQLPPTARVDAIEWRRMEPSGGGDFTIEASGAGQPALAIPPDLAVCSECLAEVSDPFARRYDYPFTNCTRCGPRFTISERPPYDRERTSMASFPMCRECADEFANENDRRYHAQPIACPACGPRLRLIAGDGTLLAAGAGALAAAITALRRSEILALKGLGGYQLVVRADDDGAVDRLRRRKRRPGKPLAVLVANVAAARALAQVSEDEARALEHRAAPIVLARRRSCELAGSVAPGQHRLGLMLPATPLHALLAKRVGLPLVCTSGNLHDEPICIDDADALERLGSIADAFLCHDRAILRRADDSVVQVVGGLMRTVRGARGLMPLSIPLDGSDRTVLAVGGHLKHAPVLAARRQALLWPQVGDLDTPRARDAMTVALADLEEFVGVTASVIAVDRHPDYATTIWAERSGRPMLRVQHHLAHIASAMAEHRCESALGFAWDGVGLGDDGSVWGGETLAVDRNGAKRVAHWRPFPLVGVDAAARDGRRALAGMCAAARVPVPNRDSQVERFAALAAVAAVAPPTTSVGRMFDAVAALTGVVAHSRFEGEAAMALEALAEPAATPYPVRIDGGIIDWGPMLSCMIAERGNAQRVASRFHATLVAVIVDISIRRRPPAVVLSGGCFHNALLLSQALTALEERGIRALAPVRVPAGDGGLALGQAWVACSRSSSCA